MIHTIICHTEKTYSEPLDGSEAILLEVDCGSSKVKDAILKAAQETFMMEYPYYTPTGYWRRKGDTYSTIKYRRTYHLDAMMETTVVAEKYIVVSRPSRTGKLWIEEVEKETKEAEEYKRKIADGFKNK